jgi:uncharacterized membrane protein
MDQVDTKIIRYGHTHSMLKPIWKAITAYMIYFGTRYVSNDIKHFCGNIMDHAIVKTFTIFCIVYQATENMRVSLVSTTIFSILQFYMTYYPKCIDVVVDDDNKN